MQPKNRKKHTINPLFRFQGRLKSSMSYPLRTPQQCLLLR